MKIHAAILAFFLARTSLAQTSDEFIAKLKKSNQPSNILLDIQKSELKGQIPTILKKAWPDLNLKQRGDLLRVVTWQKHPYALQVIDWVLNDKDRKLQNDGLTQLDRLIGNQLVFDFKKAKKWVRSNASKPLDRAQREVAKDVLHQLTSQKGRDLALNVSYLSRCEAFSDEMKTWSDVDRNRVFEIILNLALATKASPGKLQDLKGLASHIEVSPDYVRNVIVPRWYQSSNGSECSILLESLCNRRTTDFGNEIFQMFQYNLSHMDDPAKQNCIVLYDLYYRNHPDLRVAKLIFESLDQIPSKWNSEIYRFILPSVTGISTLTDPVDQWWKSWYARNKNRVAGAKPSPLFTTSEVEIADRKVMSNFVGRGEGWISKAKELWPSLTLSAKTMLLQRLPMQPMTVQRPIFELGLNDADFYLQNQALSILSNEARTVFTAIEDAQKWLIAHQDKTAEQIEIEGINSYLQQILDQPDNLAIAFISNTSSFNDHAKIRKYASPPMAKAVFEKLWKQIAAGRDTNGTAKYFLQSCQTDSETARELAETGAKDPTQQEIYRTSIMVASHRQEDWAKDLILRQFQALSKDPNGPISEYLTELTLSISNQNDARLVPYLVRLIMLKSDGERYYLDYYGLHNLTEVPYDKLHDQRWWKKWWTENGSQYATTEAVDVPDPKESASKVGALNLQGSFEEIAAAFAESVQTGDIVDNKIDSYALPLSRADSDRSIPYLIAALRALGDEFSYDIGYFHLSKAVGVPYFSGQDSQWWLDFWKHNADRFPTAGAKLPDLSLNIAQKPDANKVPAGVAESIKPIRSIRIDDTNFSDLECLKAAIGDAQVVQLGEPSHRDGATFMAKARVIRFLHEKCGFDVLVWESGMFDCDQMNLNLASGRNWSDAMELGIFPIWHVTPPVQQLFQYASSTYQTKRPLVMTGVDPQFSGQAEKLFQSSIIEFFRKGSIEIDEPTRTQLEKAIGLIQHEASGGSVEESVDTFTKLGNLIDRNRNSLEKVHGVEAVDRMVRYLGNGLVLAEMQRPSVGVESNNTRDRRMGENLAWLANGPYKGKKMIVWAASFHLMRNPSQIDTRLDTLDYSHLRDMGDWAHQALGERMYTIAFVAHHGWIGNPFFGGSLLPSAPEGSIEDWLHNAGYAYSFVDFRHLRAESPFAQAQLAGPLGYSFMRAKWPTIFDGFFFTDVMFSSSKDSIPAEAKPNK